MKKFVCVLALAATLSLPVLAQAEQVGVYVAPKFLFSQQIIDSPQMDDSYVSSGHSSSTGYVLGNDKSDSTWGGGLAIGYDFNPRFDVPIRAELEYAVRSQSKVSWSGDSLGDTDSTKMKFDVQTLFVNLYYDIKTSTAFTPYFGAGLGMAFIKGKSDLSINYGPGAPTFSGSASKSQTNFAWNVGAGVAYAITDNWDLDLGYRYVDMGEVKTGGITYQDSFGSSETYTGKADLRAHEVMLGIRYTF